MTSLRSPSPLLDAADRFEPDGQEWRDVNLVIRKLSEERLHLLATCERQREVIAALRIALVGAQKVISDQNQMPFLKVQRDIDRLRSIEVAERLCNDKTSLHSLDEDPKNLGVKWAAGRYEAAEIRCWLFVCMTFSRGLTIWRSAKRPLFINLSKFCLRTRSRRLGLRGVISPQRTLTLGVVVAVVLGLVVGLLSSDLLPD